MLCTVTPDISSLSGVVDILSAIRPVFPDYLSFSYDYVKVYYGWDTQQDSLKICLRFYSNAWLLSNVNLSEAGGVDPDKL